MKNKKIIILVIFVLIVCSICSILSFIKNNDRKNSLPSQDNSTNITNTNSNNDENINSKEDDNLNINIIINDEKFSATLVDNETSRKFISLFPLEITMNELNGNEKYNYLEESLPTRSYSPKQINEGDIMLYGSDCLVLFYKSFNTSYSYTKLGTINNPKNLSNIVGNGNIKVRFENR